MIELDSIHSLTDFKRNTTLFVEKIKQTHNPLVLTVNGRPELVVLDAESFQKMLAKIDLADSVNSNRKGIASFESGGEKLARTALDELAEKHDIPH